VDYFPRGAIEISAEAQLHPELAIERNLLLVYQRDFVFYLSKGNASLKPVIESALKQAEKSGLQKKLMDEYFGSSLQQLNLDKRVRIRLTTP
jgi:membrane-bound lytic murein transglycosylase MltF